MTRISSVLLDDTLTLIQLARETARIQGQPAQAEKLNPLVDNLKTLASEAKEVKPRPSVPPSSGVLAQDDFKTLLAAVQKSQASSPATPAPLRPSGPSERSHIVSAMALGGMSSLDIARQMGMTLDEVNTILALQQKKSDGRKDNSL